MATYLSGSPTFLPQVQPFQPDLQMFAGSLQMKQNIYDTNRKKISDLYGSLLNSPLSRDSNVAARDQFFQTIDYEIKKLANVDLSLEQNVNTAAGLFNSMYDNKNIVKDLLWTRNFNSEMERGEGFKNCVDPEKCGGQYWDGGIEALEWKRQEFRNASDQDAMMMGDVTYTPYVNVQDIASKIFNEVGWDVKTDTPNGLYMVTTKNGEQIMGDVFLHFQKTIGADPRVKEYYKTKAYLERKNYGAANAAQFGSQEAAEQNYVTETTRIINESLAKSRDNAEYRKETNKQVADDLKQNIENGDVLYDQQMQSMMDELYGEVDNLDYSQNEIGNVLGSVDNSISSRQFALQADAIDNAMAMMYLDEDLSAAAQVMSFKNYERTIKADEVALKYQEHLWRMQEISYEDSLKEKEAEEELDGDPLLSDWISGENKEAIPLKEDGSIDIEAAYKMIQSDEYEEIKIARNPTTEVLLKTFEAGQALVNSGGTGSAQAGKDIVAIIDQVIRSKVNEANFSQKPEKIKYANALQKRWKNKTDREKIGWAKTWDMESFIGKMSYDGIYKAFEVAGNMHVTNDFNLANRKYLNGLQMERSQNGTSIMGDLIQEALDGKKNVNQFRAVKKSLTDNVIKQITANSPDNEFTAYGPNKTNLYTYLVNEVGGMRSEKSFAWNMAWGETGGIDTKNIVEKYKNQIGSTSELLAIEKPWKLAWENMSREEQSKIAGKDLNKVTADQRMAARTKYLDNKWREYVTSNKNSSELYPTIIVTDKDGKKQRFEAREFFTKDGLVKKQYSKYADKWKPGEQSAFWTQYKKGQQIYTGVGSYNEEMGGFWSKVGDVAEVVLNAASTGITDAAIGASLLTPASAYPGYAKNVINYISESPNPYTTMTKGNEEAYRQMVAEGSRLAAKGNSPFLMDFKAAHVKAKVKEKDLLKGISAFSANDLFSFIDYSNPRANTVLAEQSFLKNAFEQKGKGTVRFTFSDGKGNTMGEDNPEAFKFLQMVLNQAVNPITAASRPTWVGTYNAIGGGKKDWQQYTIQLSDLKKFVDPLGLPKGESLDPVLTSLFEQNKTGAVTIYLKDSVANNALHNGTKLSSMDRRFQYKDQLPIITGKNDDIHKLKMYKLPSGGYKIKGQILSSYDPQTGEKGWDYIDHDYPGGEFSAEELSIRTSHMLEQIKRDLLSK